MQVQRGPRLGPPAHGGSALNDIRRAGQARVAAILARCEGEASRARAVEQRAAREAGRLGKPPPQPHSARF